jgi:hypothetical protein
MVDGGGNLPARFRRFELISVAAYSSGSMVTNSQSDLLFGVACSNRTWPPALHRRNGVVHLIWKSWTWLFDPDWGEKATGKELALSYIYMQQKIGSEDYYREIEPNSGHQIHMQFLSVYLYYLLCTYKQI